MTENLDMLILENDEKDKLITQIELDLKEKSQTTDMLNRGVQLATQEAKQAQE